MRLIIGLSGKQYAGKDTVADMLVSQYIGPLGFVKRSMPDCLKLELYDRYIQEGQINSAFHGIAESQKILVIDRMKAKNEQVRTDLIALGNDMRVKDPAGLCKRILAKESDRLIIIPNIRFSDEIQYFKANCDYYLSVRVEAIRDVRLDRGTLSNEQDASETALDNHWFDVTITNDGSYESLDYQVRSIAHAAAMRLSSVAMSHATRFIKDEDLETPK